MTALGSLDEMPSPEFENLCEQINCLKSIFLDFDEKEQGDYTDGELMNCRAFITFSHAEFEQYLENLSLRILDSAIKKWDKSKEISIVAAGVLAFRRRGDLVAPETLQQSGDKNSLSKILDEAFERQKKVIRENHGIKQKNFSEIYTPLGLTGDDVDETLIIQLNNTGSLRGYLTHKGAKKSLQNIRDPFNDEWEDIKFLVSELEKFDKTIQECYSI